MTPDAAPTTDEPARAIDGSTPVGVRIKAHPALCMGFGVCRQWAPEVYTLDDDGVIDFHLLEVPPELAVAARLGAQVCPSGAITVITPLPKEAVR